MFDIFKVLINDFPDLPFFGWRDIVGKCLLDIKILRVQPVFTFHVSFAAMDMDGLVALIGVEKQSPSEY